MNEMMTTKPWIDLNRERTRKEKRNKDRQKEKGETYT